MPPPSNPFTLHGPLRLSPDRTHLTHADGTPFFYLADTAWNGPLLATDADWQTYLADRAAKGFTAIQFITHAPWAGALTDREGQTAFRRLTARQAAALPRHERGRLTPNPTFFDRIVRRVEQINAAGLLAVPVLAWAANFGPSRRLNVGHTAPARDLLPLLHYQLTRLAPHHCLPILAGDAVYTFWRARKWKRVARALYSDPPPSALAVSHATPAETPSRNSALDTRNSPPLALHPAGLTWPYARFEDEPWLSLYAYQSGHSESLRTLAWLQSGPPATFWRFHPRPTINLEPCYEGLSPSRDHPPFDAAAVRRAIYWSLLNAPTAGVAYGAHGLWSWNTTEAIPLNHPHTNPAPPWHVAMNFPASHHMRHLATLMRSINWWSLRPDPTLVPPQRPGPAYISASRSPAGHLALLYLPTGRPLRLNTTPLRPDLTPTWFNPRTGDRTPATFALSNTFTPPDEHDWLLLLK